MQLALHEEGFDSERLSLSEEDLERMIVGKFEEEMAYPGHGSGILESAFLYKIFQLYEYLYDHYIKVVDPPEDQTLNQVQYEILVKAGEILEAQQRGGGRADLRAFLVMNAVDIAE